VLPENQVKNCKPLKAWDGSTKAWCIENCIAWDKHVFVNCNLDTKESDRYCDCPIEKKCVCEHNYKFDENGIC